MSGHSKWHNIKNQKGAADQRRGLEFTKLSNAIIMAVKGSGGNIDPESNFKLRLAMEKAKAMNMPKDNIQRAIDKAKGAESADLSEIIYEGFGPEGIAILVETATDNKQRTVQEMKNLFEKNGGNLAGAGAVAYLFQNLGMISVVKNEKTAEEIMEKAIELGATDLEEAGDEVIIYTEPVKLHEISENLKAIGLIIKESELTFKPTTIIDLPDQEKARRVLDFLDKIEENEAVQHVYANFDVSEEILKQL